MVWPSVLPAVQSMVGMSGSARPRENRSLGPSSLPTQASIWTAARAPAKLRAGRRGLLDLVGVPVTPRGSNTLTSPRRRPRSIVARARSAFTDETRVGPARREPPGTDHQRRRQALHQFEPLASSHPSIGVGAPWPPGLGRGLRRQGASRALGQRRDLKHLADRRLALAWPRGMAS